MRQSIEQELRRTFHALKAAHPELEGVTFKVNGRFKRKLGVCRYRRVTMADTDALAPGVTATTRYGAVKAVAVEVARYAVETPELHDDVRDTLLHEVAHVIAGHSAGHGPAWKAACVEVGANPVRCATLTEEQREAVAGATDPKWTVECAPCGVKGYAHRATRNRRRWGRCVKCKGSMTWTDNRTGAVTHSNPNWSPPVKREAGTPLTIMLGDLINR